MKLLLKYIHLFLLVLIFQARTFAQTADPASPPAWWPEATSNNANNNAIANIGQLKNMADHLYAGRFQSSSE